MSILNSSTVRRLLEWKTRNTLIERKVSWTSVCEFKTRTSACWPLDRHADVTTLVGKRDLPMGWKIRGSNPENVQTGSGTHSASCSMSTGFIPRALGDRSINLTTLLHLVPRLRMSEAVLLLWAWTGIIHYEKKMSVMCSNSLIRVSLSTYVQVHTVYDSFTGQLADLNQIIPHSRGHVRS